MYGHVRSLLCLAALAAPLAWVATPATRAAADEGYCVDFSVEKVRSGDGVLWVALFADEDAYKNNGPTALLEEVPVTEGTTEVRFCGLSAGTFSMSVFHDENHNGDLDMNRIGAPTEGFAFSGNPPLLAGKPRFKKIAFELGEDTPTHTESVRLRYLF